MFLVQVWLEEKKYSFIVTRFFVFSISMKKCYLQKMTHPDRYSSVVTDTFHTLHFWIAEALFPVSISFFYHEKYLQGKTILLCLWCLSPTFDWRGFWARREADSLVEHACIHYPTPTTINLCPVLLQPNLDPLPQLPVLCEAEADPRHHLNISTSSSRPACPAEGRILWCWATVMRPESRPPSPPASTLSSAWPYILIWALPSNASMGATQLWQRTVKGLQIHQDVSVLSDQQPEVARAGWPWPVAS